MTTARGFVKSETDRLVGTFNVDGVTRYLSVDVNLPNQLFKCSNATLTYGSVEKLVENFTWKGTIGKANLQMDLGGGVSINGPLEVPRQSSVRVRGAGVWRTAATQPDLRNPAGTQRGSGRDASADRASFDAPDDPRELERAKRLLRSGSPIIAYVAAAFIFCTETELYAA